MCINKGQWVVLLRPQPQTVGRLSTEDTIDVIDKKISYNAAFGHMVVVMHQPVKKLQ